MRMGRLILAGLLAILQPPQNFCLPFQFFHKKWAVNPPYITQIFMPTAFIYKIH
ncbi:MAG: hypothetical protein FWG68_08640 [Defluviitaleaceae bacterium]|nr:hypothetical protein [Defluviitaleaceae bacterium]